MDFSRQVVIVGGGITGLAAAHRLRELDPAVQITLIEGSARLGGVLHTQERDGFLVERGPVNSDATANESPARALTFCPMQQPWIPDKRHRHGATIL